ncbi:LptF/LptG family permease [Candidatus Babeliales bacterium]|nr:LptF/LptG family permease [Candidatus Babeliales bacterium]
MLTLYILSRLYKNFLFCFIILIFVFSVSDLFLRLSVVTSTFLLPKIAIFLIPLMAQFAIPIASALAVGTVIGNMYIEDEILLFFYFSKVKTTFYKSILFFSLSLLIFYIPIVFVWTPKSYHKGKKILLNIAKKQFWQLESNKFHEIYSRFHIFFKEKEKLDKKLILKKILLNFQDKNGAIFIVNAQEGFFEKDFLFLHNGVIQNFGKNKIYTANFEKTDIDLKQFFDQKNQDSDNKQVKFLSFAELKNYKKTEAVIEFHKRIALVFWQFLFPFLALFGIMIFARKKSNLLINIFFSGFIFLFSYISTSTAQALHNYTVIALLLLYLPPILLFFVVYFLFKK